MTTEQRKNYFKSAIETFDTKEYLTSDLKKSILSSEGGKFYKYYNFNSLVKNPLQMNSFEKGKLWASVPTAFNDPYDCMAQPFLKENNSLNQYELFQNEIKKIELHSKEFSKSQSEFIKNAIQNLSRTDLDKICLDYNIEFPSISNDESIMNYWKNRYYVVCFSTNLKSILMWSHYAKNHTGFCLEFSPDEIFFEIPDSIIGVALKELIDEAVQKGYQKNVAISHYQKQTSHKVNNIYPVCYFKDPEEFRSALNGKTIELSSLLKYQDWSYENEWRIVYPKEGVGIPEDCNFFNSNPTAIYLGSHFQESGERERRFLEKIKDREIKIFKMYLNNDFTLDFKSLM